MTSLTVRPSRLLPGIAFALVVSGCASLRGTGDLGVVVERERGNLQVVGHGVPQQLFRVPGLGDLSHASVVYSRDQRYAFVFGRDGGLTKVDLLRGRVVRRVVQAGNSIGGAISEDGRLVAVSNYEPGGVRIFDTGTLDAVADIPAVDEAGVPSKVVGLVDAPGNRFVFSLYDTSQIWVANMDDASSPVVTKFADVGLNPYDALITPDGRYYIAGLYGEDGLAMLDLWDVDAGVTRVMRDYGRGRQELPVYKMPHLEGWAVAGDFVFVPAVGHHEVLVIDRHDWQFVARVPVHGQPVFVMAQPDGRRVWVNFAMPDNDIVQILDASRFEIVETLRPGKAVLHMEFTPRGEQVWLSVRDEDRVDVYDTRSLTRIASLPAHKPSGIFFTSRAHRIGL